MLETIVEHQQSLIPTFIQNAKPCDPKPSQRSLVDALNTKERSFIFECKKASPSKGLLCADYDPVKLAKMYEPFASAVSVLTNHTYFQGSLEHLKAVSENVHCPVLCKDIIVDKSQVKLARTYGADAILLMLSVLNNEDYLSLRKQADLYHMDVITEIHTKEELNRALQLNANIIGINHRDFKTMTINFEATRLLAPLIPNDKIIVAESGINSYQDIQTLLPYASNFLIGSSITQSINPDIKLRELLFNLVKVCGLTSKTEAKIAYAKGASYGGLNFIKLSPRYITLSQATHLRAVPLKWVGIFQNHDITIVSNIANELNLEAVQLHGHETIETILELKKRLLPSIKIIKAIKVSQIKDYPLHLVDKLLVDSQYNGQFGGTGQRVDVKGIPESFMPNIILAGGLTADNIHELSHLPFAGFDINSGVESSPGIKCIKKLTQFFNNLEKTNKVK